MINQKDVIRMKIPFPNMSSDLATTPHMYICLQSGDKKELVKCQTAKPYHLLSTNEPFVFIYEDPDINRNPFTKPTLIDCDKKFLVNNVMIPLELLTTIRRDVCNNIFSNVQNTINHSNLVSEVLSREEIAILNSRIHI